jgi:TonB family protein
MTAASGGLLLAWLLPSSAVAQTVAGAVGGVVRDTAGMPLAGAAVALQTGGSAAQTGEEGTYRLNGLTPGPATLVVRRLGFRPQTHRVEIPAGGMLPLDVRLIPLPQALSPMVVRARREVYDARLEGFHARLETGRGHYLNRERLDRASSLSLPDLLRELPGVRVFPQAGGRRAVRLRGARCAPLVFVDGFPASAGEFDLDMLDVISLEGVEVYLSMSTIPPEFGAARMKEQCGVIAVWSRPAPSRRRRAASDVVDVDQLVSSGQVFTADEVQQVAQLDSAQSPPPVYPDSLWRAGVAGRVLVELVVDAEGGVEPGTIRVVSATHALFAGAVRRAMTEAVFTPARLAGRPARQVVQLPVVFTPGPLLPAAGLGPPAGPPPS